MQVEQIPVSNNCDPAHVPAKAPLHSVDVLGEPRTFHKLYLWDSGLILSEVKCLPDIWTPNSSQNNIPESSLVHTSYGVVWTSQVGTRLSVSSHVLYKTQKLIGDLIWLNHWSYHALQGAITPLEHHSQWRLWWSELWPYVTNSWQSVFVS